MKIRRTLAVAGLTLAAVGGFAAPALADTSSSPAQICKTTVTPDGPLVSDVPFEGYFYRVGGCASTVAHGGLDNGGANLSALTTQAGYVQTCQAIKSVGDWQGLADEANFFADLFGIDRTFTIRTMNDCVATLRFVHSLPLGG